MEGNSIKNFENLCKIFEMRIRLDKEKNVKTPSDVIDNYEKYSKKIDSIYNREFEKEIRNLISPETTLEKEEIRLKKLIKLLEIRLDKRRELEDHFYESTGKYIDGFQLIVSEDELEEKKTRLETITKYLTTKTEIDELTTSISKLKNSLIELEKEKEEYTEKNKIMEDSIYSSLMNSIKNDEYFTKINEDNYNTELSVVEDKVRENEETLEVTLDSVKSLMNSGTDDDYTSYIEDAEKSYYIWKNREIILRIYELVIAYEEDFDRIVAKRNKLEDLVEENNHLKNRLHIEDNNELLDFENLLLEQKESLNKEKEVLENIINYTSRIKFKEERLEELEEINNSYEILTILREYGIIDTYDTDEEEVPEDIPEEITEEVSEEDSPKEEVLEDIVNETIDPYRIKEVIDYPKTLNIGLAKLKGESVRETVNRKLNPKPKINLFDELTKDMKEEEKVEEISSTIENVKEESKQPVQEEEKVPEVNNITPEPVWTMPTEKIEPSMVEDESKDESPVWSIPKEEPKETNPVWTIPVVEPIKEEPKKDEEINKIDLENTNNMFWIPVSDSKLETKDFPNINIPINDNNFSNTKDNFGFPDLK